MSPSRTHPTGLDRIIGIVFFLYPRDILFYHRDILWEFLSDGNGRSSDLRPPSISLYVNIKRCTTHGKRSSRKNVSDHGACLNKTLTAAGLSGLLTRFPFNHYAQTMPAAAGSGSKPIALAKIQ